jgi:hypothetical protein
MARRVSTDYPQPPSLERTYRRSRTKLDGVRRFLAAEGVVPFADDKNGLGRIGGDVWLRPSATRRVGNYLDLAPPAVAGFHVKVDPLQQTQRLPIDTGSLFEQFIAVAESSKSNVVEQHSRLRLAGGTMTGGDWPWGGFLAYEHTVSIDGGERIFNEPQIPIYMREGSDGTVHVSAVLRRSGEYEHAQKWLNSCNPSAHGLHILPVRVSEEPPERHDEFWAILKDLGDEFLIGRNPSMSARERTSATQAAESAFRDFIESVPYRTKPLEWDHVLKRLDDDELSLGSITAYLWAKRQPRDGRSENAIVAVEVRQRPGQDDHTQLGWSSGRSLPNNTRPAFTEELWQGLPLLDWDEEAKTRYLLQLWEGVTGVVAAPGAQAAQASA